MTITNEIKKINYDELFNYWQDIDSKLKGQYAANYLMDNEIIAKFRFFKDLNFILSNLPKERDRFLDLGCGTGNYLLILYKYFQYCEGIDFSSYAVDVAQKRFIDIDNVKIINKNVIFADFGDAPYDLINIAELLMYLNDEDCLTLLVKIKKALKSNGVLLVRESISTKKTVNLDRGNHKTIRRTMSDFLKLFNKAGFISEKIKQNKDYNYAWMISLYCKFFPALLKNEKFIFFSLSNPVTRFIFFQIPLWLMMVLRKNSFIHYYFVFKI